MNQLLSPAQDLFVASEVPVRLEQLDGRLKAIVRTKLREFIHLTPVFQHIPTIGGSEFSRQFGAPLRIDGEIFYELDSVASLAPPVAVESDCPNRPSRITQRRRINRAVTV